MEPADKSVNVSLSAFAALFGIGVGALVSGNARVGIPVLLISALTLVIAIYPEPSRLLGTPGIVALLVLTWLVFAFDVYEHRYGTDRQALVKETAERVEKRYAKHIADLEAKATFHQEAAKAAAQAVETIARFGGNVRAYRKWDPYEDRDEVVSLGSRCGGVPCPGVRYKNFTEGRDGLVELQIGLAGAALPTAIFLRKGCYREAAYVGEYALGIHVEDDSRPAPRLGLVLYKRPPRDPWRPTPDNLNDYAPDWSRHPDFMGTQPGRIVCGDKVYTCMPSEGAIQSEAACLGSQAVRQP